MLVTCFKNGRLLRHHQLKDEDLWIADGKVIAPQLKADQEIDVGGYIISPGYIDLQINGAHGVDFSRNPEKWPIVAEALPQYGVTAFLPTIISSSSYNLAALKPRKVQGAANLGIHLEGPFLQSQYRGAHALNSLINSIDTWDIYGNMEDVRLITLAPEMPGASKFIRYLSENSIKISAGHSAASYAEIGKASNEGLGLITHLFNAMKPFHHREPGIIGAALTQPNLFYSMIADGIHLDPITLKLAWNSNPYGLFLITDSIEALGISSSNHYIGENKVFVENNKATLENGTLAGSLLSMDAAVRNFYKWTGCSLPEALEAASLRPAQALGIESYKGHLHPGADADFIFLDHQLKVKSCYIGGENVW